MFYVAPLLCIALLAWIERGAPRPRVLAAVAAVVSAVLVTAIPLDRFITTSALTDTLMLLPFWSLQDRIGADWIEVAAAGLAVGARCRVPLRAEALRARSPAGRPRSLDPRDSADLVGQARLRARLDRSAVPGDPHGRSRLGRPGAAAWRRRRVRLVGTYRSPDREPERVLQSRRRARLLRRRSDAGWPARAGDPHRPGDGRGHLPGRQPGPRRLRHRRLVLRARRRGARHGQGLGRHALARDSPLVSATRVDGLYPRDTLVRPRGHVHPATLCAGPAVRRALQRREPLPRAPDGRRALERTGPRPGELPAGRARGAQRSGRSHCRGRPSAASSTRCRRPRSRRR